MPLCAAVTLVIVRQRAAAAFYEDKSGTQTGRFGSDDCGSRWLAPWPRHYHWMRIVSPVLGGSSQDSIRVACKPQWWVATARRRRRFGGQAGVTPARRSATRVVGSRRSEARTRHLAGSPGGLPFRFPRHPKRGSASGGPRYLRLRCCPLRRWLNFAGTAPALTAAMVATPRSAPRSTANT